MRHYEQILDKVAPTFYKSIQYYDYFNKSLGSITSYLRHIEVPDVYAFMSLPSENINYFYYGSKRIGYHHIVEKTESKETIILSTKDKVKKLIELGVVSLDEFIVNMVINNFSFENDHIYVNSAENYKAAFIALVGNDLYETIRANIR